MTSLAEWGIGIVYDSPAAQNQIVLARDVDHITAVTLAIQTVKELRGKGIQDAVDIWVTGDTRRTVVRVRT